MVDSGAQECLQIVGGDGASARAGGASRARARDSHVVGCASELTAADNHCAPVVAEGALVLAVGAPDVLDLHESSRLTLRLARTAQVLTPFGVGKVTRGIPLLGDPFLEQGVALHRGLVLPTPLPYVVRHRPYWTAAPKCDSGVSNHEW